MIDIEKYLDTENWFNYKNFYDFITTKNYKRIVEIGVWKGHSISYLANKNRDSEIWAVDLFEDTTDDYYYNTGDIKKQIPIIYDIYQENLIKTNTRQIIKDLKGNSWDVSNNFSNDYFDFIFIDANHSYDYVKNDITSWYPKLKTGGIISGHDYSQKGVSEAVNEFALSLNKEVLNYTHDVWYFEK